MILSVEHLTVRLPISDGLVTIVDDVSFAVQEGEVFGIAGESGSGKTMTMLALMGLLPRGAVVEGRAFFGGQDLLALGKAELRRICGKDIAMVFQDPMTALHPMLRVGEQLTDHVRYHEGVSKDAARDRAVALLGEVRIPDPLRALRSFPHEFSGGMRQRIALAIALACSPRLLIADEPTTALDVTVQAGILRTLDRLRRSTGLSVVLITHNLGVMAAIADTVRILYSGRIVELGTAAQVLQRPAHPYTQGLLAALPRPDAAEQHRLEPIVGSPAAAHARPAGCAFHPRCPHALASCRVEVPALVALGEGRAMACPVMAPQSR